MRLIMMRRVRMLLFAMKRKIKKWQIVKCGEKCYEMILHWTVVLTNHNSGEVVDDLCVYTYMFWFKFICTILWRKWPALAIFCRQTSVKHDIDYRSLKWNFYFINWYHISSTNWSILIELYVKLAHSWWGFSSDYMEILFWAAIYRMKDWGGGSETDNPTWPDFC